MFCGPESMPLIANALPCDDPRLTPMEACRLDIANHPLCRGLPGADSFVGKQLTIEKYSSISTTSFFRIILGVVLVGGTIEPP